MLIAEQEACSVSANIYQIIFLTTDKRPDLTTTDSISTKNGAENCY